MNLEQLFLDNKEKSIGGRYLNLDAITPVLNKLNDNNQLSVIGKSVLGEPIYKYQIGSGSIKIFMWSQMHGNESTTTKGLFDFLNLLKSGSNIANQLLNSFTFCVLPMLNPDGARLYTRVNANEVDLNRDAQELSQPESKVLRDLFNEFNIKATFATVGLLLIEKKADIASVFPHQLPQYTNKKYRLTHEYLETIGSNETQDPFHFGHSLHPFGQIETERNR